MSQMNTKTVGAVVIIAILAVAAVAAVVLILPGTGPTTDPIKIGIVEPLTGSVSASGRGGLRGFEVAAAQLNEAGGILGRPVVLITEDTEGNPEKGASAATKLVTVDNVDYLMGTVLSSVAMQIAEVAADYETIYMGTNPTTSAFTQLVEDDYDRYKYLFRSNWNVSQWMYAWFDSFTGLFPDITSLAFVTEDLAWAREGTVELEKYCNATGMDYLGLLFAPGTTDFTPEIATIEAFDPDVCLVDLLYGSSLPIQKQWWALKPDILFVGASGILSYPDTVRELGPTEANLTLTYDNMWNVSLTDKTTDFFTDFVLATGGEPTGPASPSYDGLMALAQAIEAAGTTDTAAVITALEGGTFVGARGTFGFMANHQADYIPGVIIQWINDEPTVIWPASVAEGVYVRPPWVTSP
ncbi:MAG: ABC transporter substrate-binding protein [Candidatus Thorarchaeota archaeon]